MILFNFSADRPIENPEANYDTASLFKLSEKLRHLA